GSTRRSRRATTSPWPRNWVITTLRAISPTDSSTAASAGPTSSALPIMRTPAPLREESSSVRRLAGGLAAALLVAGCGNDRPSEPTAPPAAAASGECLVLVWQKQQAPNEAFDRAHDMAEGGAISCATGTTASQFEAALAAIRE